MELPNPPPVYDQHEQRNVRSAIKDADAKNMKMGDPIVTLNVVNDDTQETETIKWTNTGWVVV